MNTGPLPGSGATGPDQPRPAATGRDISDYSLSIEEVAERYAKAGHPRTIRTLQRYCVSGHLEARKVATSLGDKYLITPQSVARHIAQIEELLPLDTVAADRDLSRRVATPVAPVPEIPTPPTTGATHNDTARQSAATDGDMSRYVERLEHELEQGKDEREFLREQINRKDKTIEALIERDRETNHLIRGLQDLVPHFLQIGPSNPKKDDSAQRLQG